MLVAFQYGELVVESFSLCLLTCFEEDDPLEAHVLGGVDSEGAQSGHHFPQLSDLLDERQHELGGLVGGGSGQRQQRLHLHRQQRLRQTEHKQLPPALLEQHHLSNTDTVSWTAPTASLGAAPPAAHRHRQLHTHSRARGGMKLMVARSFVTEKFFRSCISTSDVPPTPQIAC